jgi:hypothetical protein
MLLRQRRALLRQPTNSYEASPSMRRLAAYVVPGLALSLALLRWLVPERSPTDTGPRALLDAFFAVGLMALVALLAYAIGRRILRALNLVELPRLERGVFGLPVGLGVIAYGVLALGLAGLLHRWTIIAWLAVLIAVTWRDTKEIVAGVWAWLPNQPAAWRRLSRPQQAMSVLAGLIFTATLAQALTPPWASDSLMYHLPAPRAFLQAGQLLLLPDMWQANGAFAAEMLFTLGLAFGSDTFARLVHMTYGLVMALGTFAFGQRYLGRAGGWVAAAILLGIPTLPLWAGHAYVDLAWVSYEFLALFALLRWTDRDQGGYLALAGITAGFALGSKYVALEGALVLGLGVLWHTRTRGLRVMAARGALFGALALLVASPWYLKNLIWAGNPFYPLFFGGPGWPAERLEHLMSYLHSFGAGRRPIDYLLLPWNLYARYQRFGTFAGSIDVPSLLFPLVLLYPLRRHSKAMNLVAVLILFRFALWTTGSQQTRHLLPIAPGLCLLTAAILTDGQIRPQWPRWRRVLTLGLLGGMVAVTLTYSVGQLNVTRPWRIILGLESKDTFLARILEDYPALRFIQSHLSPGQQALLLWNGRSYYCDQRCLADSEPSSWTELITEKSDTASVARELRKRGVTHLLFSAKDTDFWLQHDPDGRERQAFLFLQGAFAPACTREIYRDSWTVLAEVTCQ